MSMEFCEALTARFAEISSARAVVMTATGRTFSAGVDLVRLLEGGAPYIREFLPALSTMFATVFSHPAPVVAAEIMRCAIAPQFFAEAIFSGATYTPLEAVARGFIHEVIEPQALLERAVAAAKASAALPPTAFALSKRQIHAPALERMQSPQLDAAIEQIWTAPETLERVRDYVARTLRKS